MRLHCPTNAPVAQGIEHQLAELGVARSNRAGRIATPLRTRRDRRGHNGTESVQRAAFAAARAHLGSTSAEDVSGSSLPEDVRRPGAWLIRAVIRRRLVGEVLFGIAAVAAAGTLAACGGSDSSDSTTNPGSKNYDPAKTALANAGLEVCSEEQQGASTQITPMPGLGLARSFDVAQDCRGATVTPNKVTIFQFTNKPDFEAGVQTIKSSLPQAAVYDHYPLVIAATGPDRQANLAAVEKNLPPGLGSTTTTSS
jgi:hypothetical protein